MPTAFTPTGFAPVGLPGTAASPSPSPSVAPMDAIAWGEAAPDPGEESVTWRRWQTAPGVLVNASPDIDWGSAPVDASTPIFSPVTDTGDTLPKTFRAQQNKYGIGTGSATLSIRGNAAVFDQHSNEIAGPVWTVYTVPVFQSWR